MIKVSREVFDAVVACSDLAMMYDPREYPMIAQFFDKISGDFVGESYETYEGDSRYYIDSSYFEPILYDGRVGMVIKQPARVVDIEVKLV